MKNASVSWDDLAAFLAVAQSGGLSAAARGIGSSAPTLGRRMHALERSLARELFIRRTHGYDLTAAGAALMGELQSIAGRIDQITQMTDQDQLPLVKVSAGTWTSLFLSRQILSLSGRPTDVRIRFIASEDLLSINRREAVIGLRNRRPTEAGLAGRKLREVNFAAFAKDETVEKWVGVNVDTPSARWLASRPKTQLLHEVTQPRLALDMALAGAGKILLPTFIGEHEPGLEKVSDNIADLVHDQWLVTHDTDRSLPEVRRTLDRIADLLG